MSERDRVATAGKAVRAGALLVLWTLAGCRGGHGTPDAAAGTAAHCGGTGLACRANADCCSGSCAAGRCSCLDFAARCGNDSECCEQWACDPNGRCSFGCRADGASCTKDGANCCSGACVGGICGPPRCIAAGGACQSSVECCDDLGCALGADGRGICQPGCARVLEACGASGKAPFCCSGTSCSGVCVTTCRGVGLHCTAENQCCDGLTCTGGKCRPCAGQGNSCMQNADCCKGNCENKTCARCRTLREACTGDADCCARLRCTAGQCGCAADGASCASDDDCCLGSLCHQGHCGSSVCFDPGIRPPPSTDCQRCCGGACGQDGSCCARTGWSCQGNQGCCGSDFCDAARTCHACLATGQRSCHEDPQCCSGHCQSEVCCSTGTVAAVPDPAAAPVACGDSACCGGMQCCNDGFPPRCTLKNGAACTKDSECCQVGPNGENKGAFVSCQNGKCCEEASPYNKCNDQTDCCAPAVCAMSVVGTRTCCLVAGTPCKDYGCGNCCNPPPNFDNPGFSGTCR